MIICGQIQIYSFYKKHNIAIFRWISVGFKTFVTKKQKSITQFEWSHETSRAAYLDVRSPKVQRGFFGGVYVYLEGHPN